MGSCYTCFGNTAESTMKNVSDNKDGVQDQSDLELNKPELLESPEKPAMPHVDAKQIQGAVRGFLTRKEFQQPLFNAKDARTWFNIEKLYPKADKPIAEVQNLLVGILESKLTPFTPQKPDDGVKTVAKPAVKLNDGAIYEGEWDKNGQQHGIGTLVKEDGSKVVGLFKAGKLDGLARMIQSTGLVYEGHFRDGEMNGNGKIQNKVGGKFDGELANGKIHGKGAEEWPDGTKYDGEYKEGIRHGNGTLVLPDGSTYTGEFKNGSMHGKGELKYKNGNSYKGTFKDNKMNGKGVFVWNDGRKYTGQFKDDVKHGKGMMTWKDGKVYNGMWVDGVQHGEADYTFKNKEGALVTRKSKWENGTRVEWIDN